jgi:predicted ATPase/DNA-binding winged helix-turn-helix (wHTH) protein
MAPRVDRLWSRQVNFGKREHKLGGSAVGEPVILFGPYRLLAAQRLLLEGDKPVRLGSRAFDILIALVERAGEVVGKDELIARAWPETFVEEANLKIQVSALRRALGDGQGDNRYIATVVGRGYNFVAAVREEEASQASPSAAIAPPAPHNLPFATTRMIGREEIATRLVAQLSHQRLVTIVGPGGVGKTTVGLAVAERLIGAYEHGVWLVDLATLSGPHLVSSAVATVLGVEVRAEDLLPGLVAALRDRRVLLLLDNCEHVIDAVAGLAAALLSGTPGVNILATSREPLGVPNERVHRLGPLSSPEPTPGLTATDAAASPAVRLFVERVTAIVEDFALTDANAALVVAICRRLDGLPLAIEFAAPRVEVLGIDGLAARLDDSLPRLSGTRRRTAVPRHRTMRAVIDWSLGLLGQDEQRFFRALGIFAGGFTAEAATAVALDAATTGLNAIDRLVDLVAKSLVVADVSGTRPRFRLLDTTRAYALDKLDTSDEREAVARRHAEYFRQLFARAEDEAPARATGDWLAGYAPEIDNLRVALDWAFSPAGEASIGVALTTSAVPLWIRLSLLEECRGRARQGLGALASASTDDPREAMRQPEDMRRREVMRLHAALGASTPEASEMVAAFTETLDMARRQGDREYQLRALRGLYFYHAAMGHFRAAKPLALEFHALAVRGSDREDLIFAERTMGVAEHYVGDQMVARRHLERVLTLDALGPGAGDLSRFQDVVRFGTDSRLSVRVFLARVLWLQGFADQAVETVEKSLEEAEATGYALSQCYALALAACPIAFWVGDDAAAARYTDLLVDLSRRHVLPRWSSFGARYGRILAVKAGGPGGHSPRRSGGQEQQVEPNFSFPSLTGLMPLADALGQAGRATEGLALLEAEMPLFEESCFTPELSRLRGELSLGRGLPDTEGSAESDFRQALREARVYGTLSWELRAATSLARLLSRRGRPADAVACLQPVYDRVTEGFGTGDLIAAKQLLDDLGAAEHLSAPRE